MGKKPDVTRVVGWEKISPQEVVGKWGKNKKVEWGEVVFATARFAPEI
jgi:hypothetical protein